LDLQPDAGGVVRDIHTGMPVQLDERIAEWYDITNVQPEDVSDNPQLSSR
jgi:hypothetical protein